MTMQLKNNATLQAWSAPATMIAAWMTALFAATMDNAKSVPMTMKDAMLVSVAAE